MIYKSDNSVYTECNPTFLVIFCVSKIHFLAQKFFLHPSVMHVTLMCFRQKFFLKNTVSNEVMPWCTSKMEYGLCSSVYFYYN